MQARSGNALVALGCIVTLLFGAVIPSSAAETEELEVVSYNPFSFFDLIRNPMSGEKVTLKAELRYPPTASADKKLPAMIFVHGSSGPLHKHQTWLDLMSEMGIVSVYANHFEPRGQWSTVGNQSSVTGAAMTADALHLLNALAQHPRIDPERIGVMGTSKGGGVSVYTAWLPLQNAIAKKASFAAHIPLYPPCAHWRKKAFSKAPMMILVGELDNWTGCQQCEDSVAELRSAGFGNIRIKVYPGAHHGFDGAEGAVRIAGAYGYASCRYVVDADGRAYVSGVLMDTVQSMRRGISACATRGVTIGGTGILEEAKGDVREFIRRTLLR